MQSLQLNDEELSQTTRRAFELTALGESASTLEQKYADYIKATEELGIPREAAVQALREQLNIHEVEVEDGKRVFAPSADGFWYSGSVTKVDGERITVRFDSGGEHTCERIQLRPFSIAPGQIVHSCWKGDNSWYGARIRSYNPEKDRVEVVYRSDGTVETVPLKRIRLFAEKRPTTHRPYDWLPNPLLDLSLKLATGGALGFLIHYLLR